MKKVVLIALVISICSAFSLHKYYVSLTDMEYVKAKESIQIIINVFMDDIEKALNTDYNVDMRINTKKEIDSPEVYYNKYLQDKLHIKVNGKEEKFTFIGKEYEGDLVFFYLEIPNIKKLETVEVKNRILVQYFKNQQNIVKLKFGKKRKSEILTKQNDKAVLKF